MVRRPSFDLTVGDVVVTFLVATTVATIFTIFVVLFSVICLQIINTKARGVLGAHRYRLTPEGLFESTAVNESLHQRNPALRAWRVRGYFLIRASPLGLNAIPLRSFTDKTAADLFWEALQAKLRHAAKSKS